MIQARASSEVKKGKLKSKSRKRKVKNVALCVLLEEEIGVGRCLLSPDAGFFLVLLLPTQQPTPTHPPPPTPLVVDVSRGVGVVVFGFGVWCWGLVTGGWSFVFFPSIFGLRWGAWFQKLPTVMYNDAIRTPHIF